MENSGFFFIYTVKLPVCFPQTAVNFVFTRKEPSAGPGNTDADYFCPVPENNFQTVRAITYSITILC
jgi:hypothetical protein